MFPLQVPGGPELLIIGFIFLIFLAILIGIIGVIVYLRGHNSNNPVTEQQRIVELEHRVEELEEELDHQDDSGESGHSKIE